MQPLVVEFLLAPKISRVSEWRIDSFLKNPTHCEITVKTQVVSEFFFFFFFFMHHDISSG